MIWKRLGNKRVIHIQRMRPESRHAVKIWSLGFVDVIPSETVHGNQQDLSGILIGASVRHQVGHTHSNKTQQRSPVCHYYKGSIVQNLVKTDNNIRGEKLFNQLFKQEGGHT